MAGHKEGYAFKKGPQGVGYHKDTYAADGKQPRAAPPIAATPPAAEAANGAAADSDVDGESKDGEDNDVEALVQPLEGPLPERNLHPLPAPWLKMPVRVQQCLCGSSNTRVWHQQYEDI